MIQLLMLMLCLVLIKGIMASATGPDTVAPESMRELSELHHRSIEPEKGYEFDFGLNQDEIARQIGSSDGKQPAPLDYFDGSVPGVSTWGAGIGILSDGESELKGKARHRVLTECKESFPYNGCQKIILPGDSSAVEVKIPDAMLLRKDPVLDILSTRGGSTSSEVEQKQYSVGLGLALNWASSSAGIGGQYSAESIKSSGQGKSTVTASRTMQQYSLGLSPSAFTSMTIASRTGKDGHGLSYRGNKTRALHLNVFDDTQLHPQFREDVLALPVPKQLLDFIRERLENPTNNKGTVTLSELREKYNEDAGDTAWKQQYFQFATKYSSVVTQVEVGAQRQHKLEVAETSNNEQAKRQWRLGAAVKLMKDESLSSLQARISLGKNVSESSTTTVTKPGKNPGDEETLTSSVQRDQLANSLQPTGGSGVDHNSAMAGIKVGGDSMTSASVTDTSTAYSQSSRGGDPAAAMQAQGIGAGTASEAMWLLSASKGKLVPLRSKVEPVSQFIMFGTREECQLIQRLAAIPNPKFDYPFLSLEECIASGQPSPGEPVPEQDYENEEYQLSVQNRIARALGRKLLNVLTTEELQSKLAETAVDGALVDEYVRRAAVEGVATPKTTCKEVLVPLAETRKQAVAALLGDDVAMQVTMPNCEELASPGMIGRDGGLTTDEIRKVQGNVEGYHTGTNMCAVCQNIVVAAAINGGGMKCDPDVHPKPPEDPPACAAFEAELALPIGPGSREHHKDEVLAAKCATLPHEQYRIAFLRTVLGDSAIQCMVKGSRNLKLCPAAVVCVMAAACTREEVGIDPQLDVLPEIKVQRAMAEFHHGKDLATLNPHELYFRSPRCRTSTFTGTDALRWPGGLKLPRIAGFGQTGGIVGVAVPGSSFTSRPVPPFQDDQTGSSLGGSDALGCSEVQANRLSQIGVATISTSDLLSPGIGPSYIVPGADGDGQIHVAARAGDPFEAWTAAREMNSVLPSQSQMLNRAFHPATDKHLSIIRRSRVAVDESQYYRFELLSVAQLSCAVVGRRYPVPYTMQIQVHDNVLSLFMNTGMVMEVSRAREGPLLDKVTSTDGKIQIQQALPASLARSTTRPDTMFAPFRCIRLHVDPHVFSGATHTSGMDALRYFLGSQDQRQQSMNLDKMEKYLQKKSEAGTLQSTLTGEADATEYFKLEREVYVSSQGLHPFPSSEHVAGSLAWLSTDGGKKQRTCSQ